MKERISKGLIVGLIATVLSVVGGLAPARAVADTYFSCSDPAFYQVAKTPTGDLFKGVVNPSTGILEYTKVGSGSVGNINAIGYNQADNLIYGVASTSLYKIDAAGVFTNLGSFNTQDALTAVSGPGSGDFVANNQLLVIGTTSSMIRVDVTTRNTYEYPTDGPVQTGAWDFTILQGKAYGLTSASTPALTVVDVSHATEAFGHPTNVTASAGVITYTTPNSFSIGEKVSITGIKSSTNTGGTAGAGWNIASATVASANSTSFTVTSAQTGGTFTSGGVIRPILHVTTNNVSAAASATSPDVAQIATSGSYGASYADANGTVFFYNNGDHKVYKILASTRDTTTPKTIFVGGNAAGGTTLTAPNDGASCPNAPSPYAAAVTTTAATAKTTTSAVLNGTVSPRNAAITDAGFVWGTDPNLVTDSHSVSISSGIYSAWTTTSSNNAESTTVTGLAPGTTYYYKAFAVNNQGVSYGVVLSFTTVGIAPVDTTTAATSVMGTSATLNGQVAPGGDTTTVTFIWSTSATLAADTHSVSATPSSLVGTTMQSGTYALTGLTAGTTYYFRIVASNSKGGPINGSILSFTTASAGAVPVTYQLGSQGTGSVPTEGTHLVNETFTVASGSSMGHNRGYIFSGWKDAQNVAFAAGSVDTLTSTDVTNGGIVLTAQWGADTLHTVTYDAAGGAGVPTQASLYNGDTFQIQSGGTMIKHGFVFNGWKIGGSSVAVGSTQSMGSSDITIVADWIAASGLSVTYSCTPCGGTAPTQSALQAGDTFTVADSGTLTYAGHTFAGWVDASGNHFDTNEVATMGSSAIVFTAQWNIPGGYSVTYLAGTASGTPPTEPNHRVADQVTVSNYAPLSKLGYSFRDWMDQWNVDVQPGDMFEMVDTNVVFTAEWDLVEYTITYDPNGASGTTPTEPTHNYQETFTVDDGTGLTKSGCTFGGWSFNGGTYTDSLTVGTSNVLLTAIWNGCPVSNGGGGGGGGGAPAPAPTPKPEPAKPVEPAPTPKPEPKKIVITNDGKISTVAGEKKVVVNQVVPVKQTVSLTIPPAVKVVQVVINGKTSSATVSNTGVISLPSGTLVGPKDQVAVVASLAGQDGTQTVPVQVTNDPISIGNVNFDFGSAKLTPAAKKILDNIAKVVKDHGFTYIDLSGHTDVFTQAGFDNQKLSVQRDAAVRAYLKSLIPAGVTIKLDAKAATEPIINKTDETSRAINRRVEIIVR